MQLRRLHESFQFAAAPCAHATHHEHVLKQDKPAVHGLAIDAEPGSELRHVEKLAGRCSGVVNQPGHFIELYDRGEIGNIALSQ